MHSGIAMPKVNYNASLSDALLEINDKSLGMTTVVKNENMVGIFTDGDLRRCIGKKWTLIILLLKRL